jgi:integrase/recombinase XerD
MIKRREEPVRNNPGIYKEFRFDESAQKWIETGRFRAIRRVGPRGRSVKEQAVFDNICDAKSFRTGLIDKTPSGKNVHKGVTDQGIRFSDLVEEWKGFHFLRLERGTKGLYEKLLPHLEFLHPCNVRDLNTSAIDRLVQYWRSGSYPKTDRRETFRKELTLLRVVLHYYKKRHDPAYGIPIFPEHFQACDIVKKQKARFKALTREELGQFLETLRKGYATDLYVLALAQFGLGLRIGEVCGLKWECIDLEQGIATIRWTVDWDEKTMEALLKPRTKSGKERLVAIPSFLADELRRLKAIRDVAHPNIELVFHKRGEPLLRKVICHAHNRALEDAGITHVSGTHLMRRTAATLTLLATGNVYAVKQLLGHSHLKTTEAYIDELVGGQPVKVASALNEVLETTASPVAEPPRDNVPNFLKVILAISAS